MSIYVEVQESQCYPGDKDSQSLNNCPRIAFPDLRDIEIIFTFQATFHIGILCSKFQTTFLATFSIEVIKGNMKPFSSSDLHRELKSPCGLDSITIFDFQVASAMVVYLSNFNPNCPR